MEDEKPIDDILIEEVKQHKCLYNLGDANYKNILYKEKVWAAIAKRLNAEVEQCKKRWKSLRDMKRRANRLVRLASVRGGYVPKKQWRHTEAMAFLDETQCHRSTIGTLREAAAAVKKPRYSPEQSTPSLSECSPEKIPLPELSPAILPTDTSTSPSPSFSTDGHHCKRQILENEHAEFTQFLNAASLAINGLASCVRTTTPTQLYFAAMAEELAQADLPQLVLRSVIDQCRRIVHSTIDSNKSIVKK